MSVWHLSTHCSIQCGYREVLVLSYPLIPWSSCYPCAVISFAGSVPGRDVYRLTRLSGFTDKSHMPCCSLLLSIHQRITSSEYLFRDGTLRTTNESSFFNVERTQVRPQIALQIHYTEAGGITGHIMLFCMLMIYTTSHHRIRQQSFETFWYTHHLFIPFMLGMYTHATSCFVRDSKHAFSPFDHKNFWAHCIGYEGWRWELVGGGLYLCDRLYREVRYRRQTEIVKVVRHPYGNRIPVERPEPC